MVVGTFSLALGGCAAPKKSIPSAMASTDLAALCTPGSMSAIAASLDMRVTVRKVPNGPQLEGGTQLTAASGTIPPYCQVTGSYVTNPKTGKTANFIATFPENWNGKYLQLGCSGQCGFLRLNDPASLPIVVTAQGYPKQMIEKGYATFGNDLGHVAESPVGGSETFMFHDDGSLNKDVIEDYLLRADRVMVDMGKAFTRAVYSRKSGQTSKITRSYFSGCSQGGREAMMAATRFPDEFDGIIAGSPATDFPGVIWHGLGRMKYAHSSSPAALTTGQAAMLKSRVVKQCDALDGVKDGLIQNPAACNIDPARDFPVCRAGETSDSCISDVQVRNLSLTYSATTDDAGQNVQPGMPISDQSFGFANQIPVGDDLEQGLRGYVGSRFDSVALVTAILDPSRGPNAMLASVNRDAFDAYVDVMGKGTVMAGDFEAFMGSKTKLLWYHNLSDEALTPYTSFNKYRKLAGMYGGYDRLQESVRLFPVPGSGHCGMGGPGPSNFDAIGALEAWVEEGRAPNAIRARLPDPEKENVIMGTVNWAIESPRTMPLCMYPQMANYKGSGDVNDAANWECRDTDRRMLEVGTTGLVAGVRN